MATLQKAFSGEDLMTEPNQDTIDCMQEVMSQKAQELFRVCDKEEKGFINKKDMQRLREELPVSPDQLEVVFDSLDNDGNGFLTLEEFTEGFGAFLGLKSRPDDESRDEADDGQELDVVEEEYSAEAEDRHFRDMMMQLGAADMFKDENVVRAMWQKLRKEDTDMSSVFEEFLGRLSDDIRKSKVDFNSLESALVSKNNEHEEEVKKLYEEMELQIKQEREMIMAEEKAKEKQMKDEMEKNLEEKERQLQELSSKHQELEERLKDLNSQESTTKQENERLQKEKDRLEELLGQSQEGLEESRMYINQMQLQQKDEKIERARQALLLSEGIAIERESLVKQLDLLKDVNKQLRDDKDEAEATESRRDGPKRPSLQDELQIESSPLARQDSSQPRAKRNELCKQGSVLSKYFPNDRPPKPSSSSMDLDMPQTMYECDEIEDDDDCVDDDMDEEMLKNANVFIPSSITKTSTDDDVIISNNQAVVYSSSQHVQGHDSSMSASQDLIHEEQVQKTHQDTSSKYTEIQGTHSVATIRENKGDNKSVGIGSMRSQPVGADAQNVSEQDSISKPARIFKVVFIGDSGVGKSSFIHRFCHHEFKGNFNATIGVDFQIKTMKFQGSTVILQLWDTAGQERFRSMTKTYFRKADGVIVMYDVTSERTFTSIRNWMISVQEQVEPGTVLALLGNKNDMSEDDARRPVKTKDGLALAMEYEAIFFETSAKNDVNVEQAMEELTKFLQEKEDKKIEDCLKLTEAAPKKGCCGR